ncbi:MAT1-2-1 [Phaeosphaeria sp. MPI-PUGE-AT-0046c]|nr:MAT1-2-1 [Phaeosphaeria sp. MPI-PUGE-AT-0046c]
MNAQVHLTSARSCDVAVTLSEQAAMNIFQSTLHYCLKNWANGSATVQLSTNIEDSFGTLLVGYFVHALATEVGGPVTLAYADDHDGPKTLVHMPEFHGQQSFDEVQPNLSFATESSEKNAVQPTVPAALTKKAPRPMNCWIIFRDYMHKHLKAQHPELRVQEISTKCSEVWRNLSSDEKKVWQKAAQSAKEEHRRLHPDYKYSPRKPGEKKKRQSRKAKLAAAAAQTETPEVAFDTSVNFEPVLDTNVASTDNIAFSDFAQFTESTSFLDSEQGSTTVDLDHYDSESLRHDRLQAEFSDQLDVNNPFVLFGDEGFALRAGADGDLTLPSIFDGF